MATAPKFAEQGNEYRVLSFQKGGHTLREIAAILGLEFEEVQRIILSWLWRK